MPQTDPITKKLDMIRKCPYCPMTMAEFAKIKTPDRKR